MIQHKHLKVAAAIMGWFVFSITLSAYNKFLFGITTSVTNGNCTTIKPPAVEVNRTTRPIFRFSTRTIATARGVATRTLARQQPSSTSRNEQQQQQTLAAAANFAAPSLPAVSNPAAPSSQALGGMFHPLLTTSIHTLLHFILALFLLVGGWRYLRELGRAVVGRGSGFDTIRWHWQSIEWPGWHSYLTKLLPCALATALDIGLSNTSLKFISLSLYTMMKSTTPAFVLLMAFLFRLERIERRLLLVIVLMCAGAALMAQRPAECAVKSSSCTGDNGDEAASNSSAFWIGLLCVLIASAMSGVRWALTQILLHGGNNINNHSSSHRYEAADQTAGEELEGINRRRQRRASSSAGIPLRIVNSSLTAAASNAVALTTGDNDNDDSDSSSSSSNDNDDADDDDDGKLFDIPAPQQSNAASKRPVRSEQQKQQENHQSKPRSPTYDDDDAAEDAEDGRRLGSEDDDASYRQDDGNSSDDIDSSSNHVGDFDEQQRPSSPLLELNGTRQFRSSGQPKQLYNIFLLSPIMAVFLFILSMLVEHPFSASPTSSPNILAANAIAVFFMMLAGGLLAFIMVLSEFWLISLTGAVTLSVAGMFKELLTIITAILLFKGTNSVLQN